MACPPPGIATLVGGTREGGFNDFFEFTFVFATYFFVVVVPGDGLMGTSVGVHIVLWVYFFAGVVFEEGKLTRTDPRFVCCAIYGLFHGVFTNGGVGTHTRGVFGGGVTSLGQDDGRGVVWGLRNVGRFSLKSYTIYFGKTTEVLYAIYSSN